MGNGEWRLIYADLPGIYKLILSSKTSTPIFENKTYENGFFAFRHDYSLPFYFEVKSLEEKRLHDANERLIKRNDEIAGQNEETNKKMLKYTQNTYIVSLIMLVIAIWSLITSSEVSKVFPRFLRTSLIILLAIICILILFKLLGSS